MKVKFVPYRKPKQGKDKKKKLVALFYTDEGEYVRQVPFGSRGSSVYYDHKNDKTMRNYLARHGGSKKQNWDDPYTPGSLSRWVLWSKKSSLGAGKKAYAKKFGFKLMT